MYKCRMYILVQKKEFRVYVPADFFYLNLKAEIVLKVKCVAEVFWTVFIKNNRIFFN